MTKAMKTPFLRVTEEDLYPGFDPKEGPDIGDFWDPEAMETTPEWNGARTMWERVRTYHVLHSPRYVPIPQAYEIPRPLKVWADEIIDGATPGPMLVSGEIGVGKTHGVCATACYLGAFWDRQIYIKAPLIAVHTASRLMTQLKDYGARDAREDLYRETINAKVLVIDDLTRFKVTDHDMETLGQVVDERMGKNLPTMITLNHRPDVPLSDLVPPFLASRLESGRHAIIMGTDRRAAL